MVAGGARILLDVDTVISASYVKKITSVELPWYLLDRSLICKSSVCFYPQSIGSDISSLWFVYGQYIKLVNNQFAQTSCAFEKWYQTWLRHPQH